MENFTGYEVYTSKSNLSGIQNTTDESLAIDVGNGLDYESQDFPTTIWQTKGTHDFIVKLAMFLPVCTIGLAGNLLVIYVLKSNTHIRSPTNLIIGNMAVADMLSLIVYPCFIFVYDYFQNYQLGMGGCKAEGPIECTILLASVISITAITYDRLTAIVLRSETRIGKCKAKIIICLTWIMGILLSAPLAFFRYYKERQWKNFDEKYCTEQAIVVNIYWYVIITALVWLPLTIQIICYSAIFVKLNKYEKIIVKTFNRNQCGYKKSAAKMMFIVILTFMFCRLPFTAFIIYRHQLLKKSTSATVSAVNIKNSATMFNFVTLLLVTFYLSVVPLYKKIYNGSFFQLANLSTQSRLCARKCLKRVSNAAIIVGIIPICHDVMQVEGFYHTLWFSSKYLLIVNAAVNPLIYSVTNVTFRNAFKKTKLCRWMFTISRKTTPKKVNTKQKPPISSHSKKPKNKKIFCIFKKHCSKSTLVQDSSTKVVEIFHTKL